MTVDQRSSRFRPRDPALGRFNNHPDPVTDFLMEVEGLEARIWDRRRGVCKPGTTPEPWVEIERDMANALNSDWLSPEARKAKRGLYDLARLMPGPENEQEPERG